MNKIGLFIKTLQMPNPKRNSLLIKINVSCNQYNRKILSLKSELPLNYTAEISSDGRSWLGHATIPWDYFPPNVTLFNAYAIHGSGDNRTYESLYPVPSEKFTQPDLLVNDLITTTTLYSGLTYMYIIS